MHTNILFCFSTLLSRRVQHEQTVLRSSGALQVTEKLFQNILQLVLAVISDHKERAIISASDHGRQTCTHRERQEVTASEMMI